MDPRKKGDCAADGNSGLFAVVVFIGDGGETPESVAVVPGNWLDGGESYWAPYTKQQAFDKAVISQEKPGKNWQKYPCRILGIKDSYSKAMSQLSQAQLTSDICSEDDINLKPRKRRVPQHLVSSDDEECDGSRVHLKERRMKQQHRTPPAAPEFQLNAMHVSPQLSNVSGPRLPLGTPKESTEENNSTEVSLSVEFNEPSCELGTSSASQSVEFISNQVTPRPVQSHQDDRLGTTPASSGIIRRPANAKSTPKSDVAGNAIATTLGAVAGEKKFEILLSLMLEMKSEIRELHNQMREMKETLQDMQQSSSLATSGENISVDLPLQSKEDLTLENKLVEHIARRGGSCVKKAVRKMMSYLLSNELMKQCNWNGWCGKLGFSKMRCREIIQRSVRLNKSTKGATDEEIQREVVIFLHGAKDREGGKTARLKAKLASVASTQD